MRKSKNKPTAPDTLVKLKNTKNKEKVLKVARENEIHYFCKSNFKTNSSFLNRSKENYVDDRMTLLKC